MPNLARDRHDAPGLSRPADPQRPPRPLVRPALLAGEERDAPDQHIFRGSD
ncbi:hypothetical protein [Streptomyces sp. Amel2xC10]|uniref:hypothetical protein n=1 Tax=Streptomyces sp. Amel2xC10 TaxID=1305826 RepID=UPI0015C489DF|nr:hypothetical protein [Streptomyces sp. Amel2xC10]